MKTLRFLGIVVLLFSVLISFQFSFTGFTIIDSIKTFNPLFIITFLLGVSMIAISGKDITGGLEKALDDDVVGVVTFVRHGEKDDKEDLTELGRKQARALGTNFKEIYDAKNEGNLYLATSSSPTNRVYETVKEIMGVESKYNKPIIKDERLNADFKGDVLDKYMEIFEKKGETKANDWYINSKYGQEVAENLAEFLESKKSKFEKIKDGGKKFHYIAGTHEIFTEAILKRVLIKDGKIGFDKVEEIGGTLGYAEPVNFMLKRDGTYQINFRNEVYDVDMGELHKLVKK